MQSANSALSIRKSKCSITQQAYLDFSHNTTEKPENYTSLMALICVVYLFILLFCSANCVVGIDDMIMDFKFVWQTEISIFCSTLILCSSYNVHHHHPLLMAVQCTFCSLVCSGCRQSWENLASGLQSSTRERKLIKYLHSHSSQICYQLQRWTGCISEESRLLGCNAVWLL